RPSLVVGVQLVLSAVGTFSDGNTWNVNADVAWTASPEDIVEIDEQGVVTSLAAADAVTITATVKTNPALTASTVASVVEEARQALSPAKEHDIKSEAFVEMMDAARNDPPDKARERRFM